MKKLLLGCDIGSSSVKVSLMDSDTGVLLASATFPETEMAIDSPQPGQAEQHPELWWTNLKAACAKIFGSGNFDGSQVEAVGIAYQMHGLVMVDKNQNALRPAIIWCDSRAVEIGEKAFTALGESYCLENFLNSPGNFTASKLKWVKENEPERYAQIDKVMLPGDFIAMKMTGEIRTSLTGLSEGIFWNYKNNRLAGEILDHYGIDSGLIPEAVPSFSFQGNLTPDAAEELGLNTKAKVTYRAGDQPNNAFSLNVLKPGEIAATAGTSGAVYGIFDKPVFDPKSRVNTFIHVNQTAEVIKSGVLLCVNGTGILNSWLRKEVAKLSYPEMNALASVSPIGADGLRFYPFGNGAERILENKNVGASMHNLDFNRHNLPDMLRSAQEGIVFALNYGIDIMKGMGLNGQTIKAGHANMFLSDVFAEAFASVTNIPLELYNTDGSQGAARGAGIGAGIYVDESEAFQNLKVIKSIEPEPEKHKIYTEVYQDWLSEIKHI